VSGDVYENKGQNKWIGESPEMFMITNSLSEITGDIVGK
jgi:hypothetical protein